MRRRFGSKAALAEAVIHSLRVAGLPATAGPPRARALANLQNFHRNLLRNNAMALLGTLLAEERRHPELLEVFRTRLAGPRRALLRQALADGIRAGELPPSADPDVLTTMLIGSFHARYIIGSDLPADLGPADTPLSLARPPVITGERGQPRHPRGHLRPGRRPVRPAVAGVGVVHLLQRPFRHR